MKKKKKKNPSKPNNQNFDKNHQARENLAVINPCLKEAGVPTLEFKHTNDPATINLDKDELRLLNVLDMGKAEKLVNLMLKIQRRDKKDAHAINVLFSGNARQGMVCVNLMEKVLGLNLKSLPYNSLYKGKHYESSGLFIIASELPVADLNRGFPKEYTDIIIFDQPAEVGEYEFMHQ